jgi:hypothetical protein
MWAAGCISEQEQIDLGTNWLGAFESRKRISEIEVKNILFVLSVEILA